LLITGIHLHLIEGCNEAGSRKTEGATVDGSRFKIL